MARNAIQPFFFGVWVGGGNKRSNQQVGQLSIITGQEFRGWSTWVWTPIKDCHLPVTGIATSLSLLLLCVGAFTIRGPHLLENSMDHWEDKTPFGWEYWGNIGSLDGDFYSQVKITWGCCLNYFCNQCLELFCQEMPQVLGEATSGTMASAHPCPLLVSLCPHVLSGFEPTRPGLWLTINWR